MWLEKHFSVNPQTYISTNIDDPGKQIVSFFKLCNIEGKCKLKLFPVCLFRFVVAVVNCDVIMKSPSGIRTIRSVRIAIIVVFGVPSEGLVSSAHPIDLMNNMSE